MKQFQWCDLESYLGEFVADYDLEAIVRETTKVLDDGNRYWIDMDPDEFQTIVESHDRRSMRKTLSVTFTEGTSDVLGNCDNVETSIEFVGSGNVVTMTFGGREGSSLKYITLEDLRSIFRRIGE